MKDFFWRWCWHWRRWALRHSCCIGLRVTGWGLPRISWGRTIWRRFQNIIEMEDAPTDISSFHNKVTEQTESFDLRGHRLDSPKKGLIIIRMNDGITKKVLVKRP